MEGMWPDCAFLNKAVHGQCLRDRLSVLATHQLLSGSRTCASDVAIGLCPKESIPLPNFQSFDVQSLFWSTRWTLSNILHGSSASLLLLFVGYVATLPVANTTQRRMLGW
jgi:hypothetical protein